MSEKMIHQLLWKFRKLFLKSYTTIERKHSVKQFQAELSSILKDDIVGIYIIGSMALGDHNRKRSDIDFVVISHNIDYSKVFKKIKAVHRKLLPIHLNGIYLNIGQLGKSKGEFRSLLYHHEGRLYIGQNKNQFYEINPITWFELKHYAITIYGINATELPINFQLKNLHNYLSNNVNTYWRAWLRKCKNPFHPYYYYTLLSRNGIEWCSTGLARQLYTLKKNKIASKLNVCFYIIERHPQYSRLFKNVINHRLGNTSINAFHLKKEMLHFMEYAIDHFNNLFADLSNTKQIHLSHE